MLFSKIFENYKILNSKYISLLFYSNIVHLFFCLYKNEYYKKHIFLSVQLMILLFSLFLNSLNKAEYKTIETIFKELPEYNPKQEHTYFPCFLIDDVIYVYRAMTLFHFVNIYRYMSTRELQLFYLFYQILHFSIFNLYNFAENEFTQTHKNISNAHSSVVHCLHNVLRSKNNVTLQSEKILFPLFIVDILLQLKA